MPGTAEAGIIFWYITAVQLPSCLMLLDMLHVAWSVSLLGTTPSYAKTAEPIEMPSGCRLVLAQGGNRVAHMGATWRIRLNNPCPAALRAVATITEPTNLLLPSLYYFQMHMLPKVLCNMRRAAETKRLASRIAQLTDRQHAARPDRSNTTSSSSSSSSYTR